MICSGEMNRPVTIQAYSESRNGYGEVIKTWAAHGAATRWAKKLSQRATEKFTTDQFAGFDYTGWKLHYDATVTHLMRLVDEDGVIYDIEGVEEVGYKEEMVLITKAILE